MRVPRHFFLRFFRVLALRALQDAAYTRIRASDLPQVGGQEMQARECAAYFEKLWQEAGNEREHVRSREGHFFNWHSSARCLIPPNHGMRRK